MSKKKKKPVKGKDYITILSFQETMDIESSNEPWM
jgi:hypothetical protein